MDWTALSGLNDGMKRARILQTACELTLFDRTTEPVDAASLAAELDADVRGVRILADALVPLGLLDKDAEARYMNTKAAEAWLVTGADASFAGMVRFDAMNWAVWEGLPEAVRTGRPQREAGGTFQEDPEATERFMRAMVAVGTARGDTGALPERVDLSERRMLVDVGGGPGHFTRALLQAYPTLEAVIVDLPATLEVTQHLIDETWGPEQERVMLVQGDYLEDPIPACDAVLLSNILHGETPEGCQRLLGNVADAMLAGGQLVIKEHILEPSRTSPGIAALFAVDMLLFTDGDCYTLDQVRTWLEDAGFEHVQEDPPRPPLTSSLVTATRGARDEA